MPGAKPLKPRFESKYAKASNGCWEWTASLTRHGYGQIRTGTVKGGGRTMTKAHRVSWVLHCGPIPNGLCVLHRCDNRRCVNPAHLFLGTSPENTADMLRKGREARGERHGNHKLTDEQVAEIRSLEGMMLQREIAAMFGVRQTTVSNILSGKRRPKPTQPDRDLRRYHDKYRQKEAV